MKKVLYIVVDALATRVVEPALNAGRLPNTTKLIDMGVMRPECIAIFPSITPAATCALATGCYPREHGIAGAYWYDPDRDEVAYFGTDIWAILNEGVDHFLMDFQRELNVSRLQVPTIFEHVEGQGQLHAAVINLLWFRAAVEHEVSWPLLFKLAPVRTVDTMLGPHLMFMGDFVNSRLPSGEQIQVRGGMLRRYGFHDETTADYLLQLAEAGSLPDFTLAYFPNNDFDSHEKGPSNAVDDLEEFDKHLGRFFEIHGGLAQTLEQFAILITGDHSQSDLPSAKEAAVNLDEILEDFQVTKAGHAWQTSDDIMVCPNMRAAQIYFREASWKNRSKVIEKLLSCEDVDQVIWCNSNDGLNGNKHAEFHVLTADRGELHFSPARLADSMGNDDYSAGWEWSGNLAAVDASVDNQQHLTFGDYPNAFERIATAFFRQIGNLWVTARLGREFCLPGTTCNERGSHGSLHALDSTSPLIAAGLPPSLELPAKPRSVDLVPICLQTLDLEPPRMPGASHI